MLGRIDATPGGGVRRPAFGDADLKARAWFHARVERSGPVYAGSAAGNRIDGLSGIWQGDPCVWIGSHPNSVFNDGRFDGAYRVAGSAALGTIRFRLKIVLLIAVCLIMAAPFALVVGDEMPVREFWLQA